MMGNHASLMEDAAVEHVAHIAAMAEEPGLPGVFARLIQIVNPNDVPAFIKREMERGSAPGDITRAIADVIAYQIVLAALSSTAPAVQLAALSGRINKSAMSLLSGETPVAGVAQNLSSGKEDHITVVGLFNGRGPK